MRIMTDKTTRVSRRNFLKGAAFVSAAAVAGGLAACDGTNSGGATGGNSAAIKWSDTVDIVVVGGGGTGCACALSAGEAGASVILLESSPALGGCSALCVGSLTTPGSKMQADKGIQDSAESYLEDAEHHLPKTAKARAGDDWAIFELQAKEGGKTIDWLVDHGVKFNGPLAYPGNTNDRMHMLTPKSSAWPLVLQPLIEAAGGKILLNTKGVELVVQDGRIIGVKAVDQITKEELFFQGTKGVLIASASCDASYDLKIRATADSEACKIDAACAYNDGTGLMMCQMIGAGLTTWEGAASGGLRCQAPSLNVGVYGKQNWMPYGMIAAGSIMVTKQGKRFASEDLNGTAMTIEVNKLPERQAWMFYDDSVARNFQKNPDMVVSSMPEVGWGTVDDFVAAGSIMKANTVEEVAALAGLDPAGLAAEVEKYNGFATSGSDSDFGRKAFGLEAAGTLNKPLNTPPYYIHGPQKGEVTSAPLTLNINTNFEVKNVFGDVIPGLYAGGNAGKGRAPMSVGHGTQMTWAFTSGRLAGTILAGN
jgi:fumarate reductase flavoprotein subunit